MKRRAAGNTTASRVKALLLHVQTVRGRADADAFLLQTKLDRDYLDDETRPLPIERWHAALVAFASRWGRDDIPRTAHAVVHPDNLGVWTRVLRGTENVMAALRQLEHLGGDEVLTDRWSTLEEEPGRWLGSTPAHGDLERDGLCALARATELAAVPLLFGLRSAGVVTHGTTAKGQPRIDYELRWSEPGRGALLTGVAAGLLGSGAATFGWGLAAPTAAAASAGLTLAGGGLGLLVTQNARRRAQVSSQLTRIQALERGAALREARERGALSFGEGTVIAGRYRLGRKLGAGASGAIYDAVRLDDGGDVAIKLLRAAVAHDNLAADRLRREAAALGLAWHPNVVEIYDEGHLPDGTSYLVIERLHGESLAARLKRRGAMAPETVLPIAVQVCDALTAVHAAGVIHRDLKPSNIFLTRDLHDADGDAGTAAPSTPALAGGERVKLLDFGVARVEWAETRLTNMGVPLGTPGYMAPEQEQGVEVDQRADVFSLGAVVYECLTGEPPPVRTAELWRRDGTDPSPSGVQRALQTIAEPWREVVDRALAEHPRERFEDARAMKRALLRLGPGGTSRSGTV